MAGLPLIVFDVNETLLDLGTMEPTFERIFGEKNAMRLWFANFIMYSAALTVAGCYVPFTDIGSAVMKMLADTRGIKIGDEDKRELVERFSTMPPHAEVPAALRKLRNAGFRLFTLTDNLLEVQTRQLEHGGIVDLFAAIQRGRREAPQTVLEAYAYVEKEPGGRARPVLPRRLPHLGYPRRRRGGLGGSADQACRERCFGSRSPAAACRRRPERRRRSTHRPAHITSLTHRTATGPFPARLNDRAPV